MIPTLHRPLTAGERALERGMSALTSGDLPKALEILRKVARNNLLDADAQLNYGVALHQARRYEEALEQFGRADSLKPRRWQVYQNLGAAYHGLKRYEEAHAATLESVKLNPDNAPAYYHLGDVMLIWGEMAEAAAYYRRCLEIDPDVHDAWVGLLFCLDLLPEVTAEQALAERRAFSNHFERALSRYRQPHPNTRESGRQLRLGYLSGDFRDHTAAYMFGPIYEHHDRDRFLVFSYADLAMEDSVGQWFRQASNGWRNIHGASPQQVDQVIRADQIDILIDTAGYTSGGHLLNFCTKPSPIQVQAWGYLTGSGLDAMDAILVDDVLVPPEHEAHFTERALRVPYALGFTGRADGGNDLEVPIMPRPDDRPVTFGHLGRSDKISQQAVELWADTMHAHPGSRMLLKDRGLQQERTRRRVRGMFAARGIGPDRLDLRGWTDRVPHLEAYNDVDVILDSLPQGGGTTTLEALWMGTPVMTMLGPRIISRIAATTVLTLGKRAWMADDRDDFIRRAGSIATDGGAHLRGELLGSIVCDGAARTRQFEDALLGLWAEWCEKGD